MKQRTGFLSGSSKSCRPGLLRIATSGGAGPSEVVTAAEEDPESHQTNTSR